MAKGNHKCAYCGKTSPDEEMVIIDKKYYHKGDCEEWALNDKEQRKLKAEDWDMLFKYICKLYNIDKPNGMMFKQLKTFREDYEFTDFGMYCALRYFYEIEGGLLLDTNEQIVGLGIIPYIYDRARKHYERLWGIEDNMAEFKIEEREEVIISAPRKSEYKKEHKKLKKINLSDILDYDDEPSIE